MIKLTFLGDVMCQVQLLQKYKNENGYDFSEIFDKSKEILKKSDMVLANLETPISKDESQFTKGQYSFSSPYEFAKALYDTGIKCVSTANNHCLDRGIEGINSTINCLDEIGILHTGTFKTKKAPLVIEIDKIKIGILSYTYGTNAFDNNYYLNRKNKYHVNLFQNQELSNPITRYCYKNRNIFTRIYNKIMKLFFKENANCYVYERKEFDFKCKKKLKLDIKQTKDAGADIIVMCMHMGGQFNDIPTKRTKKITEELLKNGVNIVVGNHEHVVHGGEFKEINNNKIATYSLGNFNGTYGVLENPFHKKAEYSIAWHVYLEKNDEKVRINKTTFSVLKTVKTKDGGIQTLPLYNLITEEKNGANKENLIRDMKEIAYKFSGNIYEKLYEEYEIN